MKIDGYGLANTESSFSLSPAGAEKSGAAEKSTGAGRPTQNRTGAQSAVPEDTTRFSSGAASVQALTQAAVQAASGTSSRAARIVSLQRAVESGQYSVDAATIAAALANSDI